MIIGISAKIGSGKDTVGEIIRYLISYQINGGNWSYPDGFKPNIQYTESKWEIKKFADKLKDIVCLLIGCTREQLEDRGFKETPLGEEWRNLFDKNGKITLHKDLEGYSSVLTPRKLLQLLGTECGREILHPNIWVNALFSEYKEIIPSDGISNFHSPRMSTRSFLPEYPKWIITDLRFPNELKAVKDRGGITIRIHRDSGLEYKHTDKDVLDMLNGMGYEDIDDDFSEEAINEGFRWSETLQKWSFDEDNFQEHPSETALDNVEFDYTIDNNGTIGDLVEKVKEILIKEKLI